MLRDGPLEARRVLPSVDVRRWHGRLAHEDLAALIKAVWAAPFAISAAISAVGLLSMAALGRLTAYAADDYCTAATVRSAGWLAAQGHWYGAWTGRFAATGLTTGIEALGAAQLIAPLLLTGLVAAFAAASRSWSLGLIAAFALAVTLPYQDLYWLSGAATYVPPLILWAFAYALRDRPLAVVALAILAAGFSETAAFVGVVAGLVLRRRDLFAGSALGALVVLAAPGNAYRLAGLPEPDLLHALALTPLAAGGVIAHAAPAALLAFAIGFLAEPVDRRTFRIASIAALVLLLASVFPAVWATSGPPPERALVIGKALVLLWAAVLGRSLSGDLPGASRRPAQVLVLAVPVIAFAAFVWNLGAVGLDGPGTQWVASCIARYTGAGG